MSTLALIAVEGESQPILIPHLADLVWGSVTFLILLALFSKYALPRFNKVLAERSDKIEGGLARAEQAQAEAQKALADYTAQLAEARAEAAAIRNAAADEKRHVVEEAKVQAVAEANAVHARNAEQVKAERNQAATELQRSVGALAIDLASKVVGESLSDDAKARAVVDKFIADLERQAAEAGR